MTAEYWLLWFRRFHAALQQLLVDIRSAPVARLPLCRPGRLWHGLPSRATGDASIKNHKCVSKGREQLPASIRLSLSTCRGAVSGRDLREAREALEASFMDEAEMVFTTLSSASRHAFSKVKRAFDLVLIDEAAQAAEVAALQPLVYGCCHAVLVGDPQQLPATLFSPQVRLQRGLMLHA